MIILYYILLSISWAVPGKKLSCDFAGEFEKGYLKGCATLSETDAIVLNSNLYKLIYFKANGLAEIYFHDEGCYWYSKQKILKKTICVEKASDPFSDGLARRISAKGKIGFMNEKLQNIVPAKYDFATPFSAGMARVCVHCHGDENSAQGGSWSIIDRSGKILRKCPDAQDREHCHLRSKVSK